MDNLIISSFRSSFLAMGEIFILMAIGFWVVKRKILKPEIVNQLSELVIYVTLPLMIFSRLVTGFDVKVLKLWWVLPLVSIGMILFSFILAELAARIFHIQNNRLEFKSLISFQNSGYLPLALVSSLIKPPESDIAILYILFFLMGFNFLIWSWGVALLRGKPEKLDWSKFFSPPFIAVLVSLLAVFTGLNRLIPETMTKPLKMLGDSTVPLGLFIVGGALAGCRIGKKMKYDVSVVIFLKLIVIPLIFLGILFLLKFHHLISLIILIEAAMPSATSLVLIAKVYRAEQDYISKGILLTHLFSLITIPIFLFLFFRIF